MQAAKDILNMEKDDFYRKYNLPPDVRDWRYEWAREDIEQFGITNNLVRPICYRPFDIRHIVYTGKTRGFIGWPVVHVMRHFLEGDNVGLVTIRRSRNSEDWREIFVSREIGVGATTITALDINYFFPLYLYPVETQETIGGEAERKPNLNADIVQQIADQIGLRFVPEQTAAADTFAPVDILDYIYAALHSPAYRNKFREFLKIDFPRVPYPRDGKHFRTLAKLGAELRALHLMESAKLDCLITTYPKPGDNTVTRSIVKGDFEVTDPAAGTGRVRLNATQYFGEVPQTAWDFTIGGYQPAQKYLKDRKDRALTPDEIRHYQRIIVALVETAKLMAQIDAVA